jgi:polysaccharide biosynthesis transport protein
MEQDTKTFSDLIEIVRRRRMSLFLPMGIIVAVAIIVAIALPSVYRSTSTILIEEQEMPRDFVIATITSFAEQRLQTINQRIMSSSRLLEIINRFNLYADLRSSTPTEQIVANMRKDIKFETVSADVLDRKTSRPMSATIAFTLSYDGRNPDVVQRVASTLASLYLEENLKVREQQTAGASKFLEEEARELQAQLAQVDARISAFKQRHITALPEMLGVNLQGLDWADRDLDKLKDQLRSLREREGYLETQLAAIPTDTMSQDRMLLKDLKARLVQLESRFSSKYPDVIKARSEIAELERRVSEQPKPAGSSKWETTRGSITDQPDNPAYVTLAAQLSSTRSEIQSVERQIKDGHGKKKDYQARTEQTPRVEEEYKILAMQRNNLQTKYDDLMRKVMEARVAVGLEKEQLGEHFTLIDTAKLPESPVKPNIPVIILIGIVLGIGGGVGSAALREYSDTSVRDSLHLEQATGFPVLGTVPFIKTAGDKTRVSRRYKMVAIGTAGAVVVFIVLFHFFVMDLTIAMSRVVR